MSSAVFVDARRNTRMKFLHKAWRTALGRCDFLPALEPGLRDGCARLAAGDAFDAIVLPSVLMGSLPLPSGIPIVADSHNVEFDVHRRVAASADRLIRRLYAARQSRATRDEERRCGRSAHLVLATSARDRRLFRDELQIRDPVVIPNGIDLAEFRPTAAPASSRRILFTGLMSYYANQHGIRWFLDRVWPLVRHRVPDATVVVAGAAPPRWLLARRGPHVEVTGQVMDMRPHIAGAGVVIAPLAIGGGTRVKILEAQAMARPVVSTTAGAEGLGQRDGESILIADDAESFAAQVIRVLRDRAAADRIAMGGRRHVVQHFDWDRVGEKLNRVLEERFGLRGEAGDERAHSVPAVSSDRAVSAAQASRRPLR